MPTAVGTAYDDSSQHRRWTFTPAQLKARRADKHADVVAACRRNRREEVRLRADSASNGGADGENGGDGARAGDVGEGEDLQYPTIEQELILIDHYARAVFDKLGRPFNLPSHLRATAAAYLRRFYLSRSVLQFDIAQMAVAVLWLSTKTCEWHVGLDAFAAKLGVEKEYVLQYEFDLASTLGFDFVVWPPYRPLYGFHLDISASRAAQQVGNSGGDGSEGGREQQRKDALGAVHDRAKTLVNRAVVTDMPFVHSPSLIALAALAKADRALVAAYCAEKGLDLMSKLDEITFDDIDRDTDAEEDAAQVAQIEAIVKAARDPAGNPESLLYSHRQRARDDEESERRRRKNDQSRRHNDALAASVLA